MFSKIKHKLAYVNFFLLLFFFLILGVSYSSRVSAVGNPYENLKIFSEVLSLVQSNYVTEIEAGKLIEGAIKGMLKELDPHTSYMPVEAYKEMQVETEGKFGGLGIEITIKDDILTVVSPIEGTPAFEAGIKAGDKIIKVDGEFTKDLNLLEAVKKLRGKPGTQVTLSIMREEFQLPKDFTITRDIIQVKSVKTKKIDPEVGYIRIRSFTKTTDKELDEALAKMEKENGGIKGLVLDLRNNPGGLLNEAVAVTERFIEKGKLVVYTQGRIKDQDMRFVSDYNRPYTDFPMVILVNAGSASASEIVAGALQDVKRALVMGVHTFGKGSVQTIIPLSDGSGLRLTTARYYTPSGKVIQENGITPDLLVENPPALPQQQEEAKDEKNPATKLETIREKDLDQHLKGKTDKEKPANPAEKKENGDQNGNGALEEINAQDVQLQRAVGLVKGVTLYKKMLTSPQAG